jgi:predicted transposase YbfD/YdcC
LRAEVAAAFAVTEPSQTPVAHDKGHGRIETRRTAVRHDTVWRDGARRYPGERRLPGLAGLVRTEATVAAKGAIRKETRYIASSRPLSPEAAAEAIRDHRALGNSLNRGRDVTVANDLSRLRKGHGARNMATLRHVALNLVRAANDKRSITSRRKRAGWDTPHLAAILDVSQG